MSFDLDEQSYEIEDELKVRGILEEHTDWQFEFTKNSKYAPDLQLHNWGDRPDSPDDRDLTGYIEVEVTNEDSDWQSGPLPDHWPEIRFCKRKIRDRDYDTGTWGPLKDTARQTVYLKFNHELDNCFAASIERIYHDGYQTELYEGGPRWQFYCLHPEHDSLTYGIRDCVEFIEQYFNQLEDDQSSLSQFDSGQSQEGSDD